MRKSLVLLVALAILCNYATLAHSMTVVVENAMNEELYPRLVYADGSPSTTSVDYPPVPSKRNSPVSMEMDRPWSLFFATKCTLDGWGHLMNCRTGDCKEGRCTLVDQPVATRISYDHRTVKVTTEYGYNCGLNGIFLCVDCDCPSFSCVIDLDRCPEYLRVHGDSGALVACKPGEGLPSGQDCPAVGSYSVPPSAGATCPFKNVILKIKVSSHGSF